MKKAILFLALAMAFASSMSMAQQNPEDDKKADQQEQSQ